MTARSFTEAFAARQDLDLDAIEARAARAHTLADDDADVDAAAALDTLVERSIPSLIEAARDRERAIRWAVTLEGQNAAALALHQSIPYDFNGTNYCSTCVDEAGENALAWPCPTVAALTGSTE